MTSFSLPLTFSNPVVPSRAATRAGGLPSTAGRVPIDVGPTCSRGDAREAQWT
jgi:hypothetical protein